MGIPQDTTSSTQPTFLGHPRGLATLFFTEMWERFSYYGMRALLVLYMTTPLVGLVTRHASQLTSHAAVVANDQGAATNSDNASDDAAPATATAGKLAPRKIPEGHSNLGMGMNKATAAAIYGLYTSLVYFLSLAGGWAADNVWGQRKSVFLGGCVIAAGHFSMAVPTTPFFFLGLILIIIGTGLLKPNVSTMVGDLYKNEPGDSGARRDAGFSIFYMGINLGAMLGPLLCGYLGENINWHLGFSLAGIGMVAGLIQYKMTERYLGDAGEMDPKADPMVIRSRAKMLYLASFLALVVVAGGAYVASLLQLDLQSIAKGFGYGVLAIVALYFIYLWTLAGHTADEKKRIGVIFWLFLLSAIFWSGFEQAGSSMNIFARDYTNRDFWGWNMPASWLQSVNSVFIILLAPVFGWAWVSLARMNANPSTPMKFALGLLGLGGGFFVLAWGAANASATAPAATTWLVVTYFLHTVGELCLSPVGLSSVTKLSPAGRVGQMMGIWFVATAVGNLFAGLVAASLEELPPSELFPIVATITAGAGLVALFATPLIKWLAGKNV